MRRSVNASYDHIYIGVNIVCHTFVVIVKCGDNLTGETSVPDDDFVKCCFRKVFLILISLWPYRELSEWLPCGSYSINAILVNKVYDFFP